MVVIFDVSLFRQQRPQFGDITKYSDTFLQNCFDEATLICNNTDASIVPYSPSNNINDRQILLYLLTCHIATLATSGQVGSITSATEGSVSAGFYIDQRKGAAWFTQTQCGYTCWQMIQKYRLGGLFVPGIKKH